MPCFRLRIFKKKHKQTEQPDQPQNEQPDRQRDEQPDPPGNDQEHIEGGDRFIVNVGIPLTMPLKSILLLTIVWIARTGTRWTFPSRTYTIHHRLQHRVRHSTKFLSNSYLTFPALWRFMGWEGIGGKHGQKTESFGCEIFSHLSFQAPESCHSAITRTQLLAKPPRISTM